MSRRRVPGWAVASGPCASGSTREARSPTSWPPTVASPRCRPPRGTPAMPSAPVLPRCSSTAPIARPVLAHGTTVATNALLERRGATVALVTTAGFADVIEIARQDRPSLYDPWADRPEPLVSRSRRLEVGGRLDHRGVEIEPVPGDGCPTVPDGVEAVAVCLLHSDLDPAHERAVAAVLEARGPRRVGVGRRVAAVPRVRAHRHHGGERLPAAHLPALPRGARRCRHGRCW